MSTYYVAPKERPVWWIDHELVSGRLAARWGAVVTRDATRSFPLRWHLSIDGARLDGSLDDEGTTFVIDAGLPAAAAFAIWIRSILPRSHKLFFFDEGYTADVDLDEVGDALALARVYADRLGRPG